MDALIIDYSAQTSFGSALRTNIPILFLDTGQIEFNKEVTDNLSSRVGYVRVQQVNIREWVIQEQDFERITREAIEKRQSDKFLRFVSA